MIKYKNLTIFQELIIYISSFCYLVDYILFGGLIKEKRLVFLNCYLHIGVLILLFFFAQVTY